MCCCPALRPRQDQRGAGGRGFAIRVCGTRALSFSGQKQAVELVAVYLREQESGLEIRSLIKTPIGCWPGIG